MGFTEKYIEQKVLQYFIFYFKDNWYFYISSSEFFLRKMSNNSRKIMSQWLWNFGYGVDKLGFPIIASIARHINRHISTIRSFFSSNFRLLYTVQCTWLACYICANSVVTRVHKGGVWFLLSSKGFPIATLAEMPWVLESHM